ncbi:MAG TPA: hypothetical protein VKX17_13690 [Planctomycetota bacterium]|nr:hypothetical protein [Planctomycetota bacterium]
MSYLKKLTKAGCQAIDDAFDPHDKQTWTLLLADASIKVAPKLGKTYTLTLAECVPFSIKKPIAVYQGLNRIGEEKGLAYVARPPYKFIGGQKTAVKTTDVFFAFVNEDRIVFEWRWEELSPNNLLNQHEGNDARFAERIHP